jgi:membrane protein involved in colicin uptake
MRVNRGSGGHYPTRAQARENPVVDERFSAEEMQAIREQYEERLSLLEAQRDELEFKLRMVLARVRDAEQGSRRAADDMAQAHAMLSSLVEPDAKPAQAASPPLFDKRLIAWPH